MESVKLRVLVLSAVLFACLWLVGTSPARASAYTPPVPEDLSPLSWTQAFDSLCTKMAGEYAFTDWRSIDFPGLRAKYRPIVERAENDGDETAYYLALRAFTQEFQDGHVYLAPWGDEPAAIMETTEERLAGGGFGLIATRVSGGGVIASWVDPDGPAAQAGMKVGARLLFWNGLPIQAALARASAVLGPSAATQYRVGYEKARFFVRAPIGGLRTVVYRNPRECTSVSAILQAVADGGETLNMTDDRSVYYLGLPDEAVEHWILPGGIGYVRLYIEEDLPLAGDGPRTSTLELFRAAMADFISAGVSGIVLDVRNNAGGSDLMATQILGSFYAARTIYEYQNFRLPGTDHFEIWVGDDFGDFDRPGEALWIEPAPQVYAGPVVCLANNGTISNGEGLAMGIKNLPNGRLVGMESTNGSFGLAGDMALMPLGFIVKWPFGQSLDRFRRVQIDSRMGKGGVTPEVWVPWTARNAIALYAGEDVVLKAGLAELAQMRR